MCDKVTEIENALVIEGLGWCDEEANVFENVTVTIETFRVRPSSRQVWESENFFWLKVISVNSTLAEEVEYEDFETMVKALESFAV